MFPFCQLINCQNTVTVTKIECTFLLSKAAMFSRVKQMKKIYIVIKQLTTSVRIIAKMEQQISQLFIDFKSI